MFTHQNPVNLALDFPPRDRIEPLLRHNRDHIRPVTPDMGSGQDDGVGIMQDMRREEQGHRQQIGFPIPRMEIPIFERDNSRWWVQKCERMFEWYDVLEG